MSEIKSALEIAMGKAAALGEVTAEERLAWKHTPEGEKLSGEYLQEEIDIASALQKIPETGRKYALLGAKNIFIKGIDLPKTELQRIRMERAMAGLSSVITDKAAAESLFERVRGVVAHYEKHAAEQKQQAYQQLKAAYTERMSQMIRQKYGSNAAAPDIDVERQPGFQEEWRQSQLALENQYNQHFEAARQELKILK
ncbi:hypothetical protein ACFLTW_03865 [Chloroflexota bacterium]